MINEWIVKDFGLRIKQLRAEKNISQEKLSFITGFHRTYICMVERGERNISLTNRAVFAKALKMTISELLGLGSINPNIPIKDTKLKLKISVKETFICTDIV